MKTLYNTIQESLLSDIDVTMQNGDNEITKITSIFSNYKLTNVFGGNNKSDHEYTEQFFDDNVNKLEKESFFNNDLQLQFAKKRKYHKHVNFGKWLERICLGDIKGIKEPLDKYIFTSDLEEMDISKKIINLAIKNKLINTDNKVEIDIFSRKLLPGYKHIFVLLYMNNDKSRCVSYTFETKI
jgi:hypothetical protein